MNCLKCGRETRPGAVFCTQCQEVMQQYPVKPGAVIHLPNRDTFTSARKTQSEHWEETSSDQLQQLRKLTRWLTATIALLSLLLCVATGMLIHALNQNATAPAIGRNYTTAQDK